MGKKRSRLSISRGEGDDIIILPLKKEGQIAVVGSRKMVEKASCVIEETQKQLNDPAEMTVYWYTCRHSDPIEVSEVLEKVYISLTYSNIEGIEKSSSKKTATAETDINISDVPPVYGGPTHPPYVNPPVAVHGTIKEQEQKSTTMNFIPYPKTGSIMMVVKKSTLPKIKELLKKLDVPKKMVQIEVLLFEKKIRNQNNFGLNLLKLGTAAKNVKQTGLEYENGPGVKNRGILQFFLSRMKSKHFPAIDFAYNFLMSQEDVRVNASPSVTTLNQTPAQISIVEEISINNGAAPLETNTGITFEKSYSRAQYGINLVITPTVHEPELDSFSGKRFVTLETNVSFDNIKTDVDDRPKVNRRSIQNQVRVMDGETLILGGLHQKRSEDDTEKIPFLGEIPGLGKFFGTSRLSDQKTEMFVFITPKVILDKKQEMEKIRTEELKKRPGDLPEFFEKIQEAHDLKKQSIFHNSFRLLFGKADG